MTTLYGQNYTGQYLTKPSQKINKGEVAGRKRLLVDRIVVPAVAALNDEIIIGVLPANSLVTDAKIFVNKSLGATGIFTLGHKATTDELGNVIAEDEDGFCGAADAGGQAALARAGATSVALYKRLGSETVVFIKVTEVTDGSVADGVLVAEIEYVND